MSEMIYYNQGDLFIQLCKCVNIYEGMSATGKSFLPRFAEKFRMRPHLSEVPQKKNMMC